MRHLIFTPTFVLALALAPQIAWSMSSPGPRALHVLIKMADVIAVVHVTERLDENLGVDGARARVDRVVYGDAKQGQVITIHEFDHNGCAGPVAVYEVGQRVLVLLHRNEKRAYEACGNLYGARILDDDQQAQCIARIKEFYRIRAVKDDETRKRHWTEWAVRCAEQPSTLADGLALLGRGTYYEFGVISMPSDPTRYYPLVNQDQRRRLLRILEDALVTKQIPAECCGVMRDLSYIDQDEELRRLAFEAQDALVMSDSVPDLA